jgi:hypothetical protein
MSTAYLIILLFGFASMPVVIFALAWLSIRHGLPVSLSVVLLDGYLMLIALAFTIASLVKHDSLISTCGFGAVTAHEAWVMWQDWKDHRKNKKRKASRVIGLVVDLGHRLGVQPA